MFRHLFRTSGVLRSAFDFSAASSGAGAAASAVQQHASESADASSTAAALWQHGSISSDAAAAHASSSALALMHYGMTSATDHAEGSSSGSGGSGYVGFSGGFGPRHLAEVAIVPESSLRGNNNAARSRSVTETTQQQQQEEDTTTATTAANSALHDIDEHAARRPVITKARRIRLAAAASQAAEVLQAVGTPATALLHSQRVQQLQAEEALLNASLQRLKAERDLAKVRHTYDEELHNFRRGVGQRERDVLLATHPKKKKAMLMADPVVSYAQESGTGDAEMMVEGDLLGMTATADAEAAAAAAAAAVTGAARGTTTKKSVQSARAKVHRESRAAQPSRAAARTPAPAKVKQQNKKSGVRSRAVPLPVKPVPKKSRTTPSRLTVKAAVSKPSTQKKKEIARGIVSPARQQQKKMKTQSGKAAPAKKKTSTATQRAGQKGRKDQKKVAAAPPQKAKRPLKAPKPAPAKKKPPTKAKATPASTKTPLKAKKPTAAKGKPTKKTVKK